MKKKLLDLILLLISLTLIFIANFEIIRFVKPVKSANNTKIATFRPLYQGYGRGTVRLTSVGENTTIIDREINLEGWNISVFGYDEMGRLASSLAIHVVHCAPEWWFWFGSNVYYPPPLRLYISIDRGQTFPYYIDFPRHTTIMKKKWSPYNETTYWLYCEVIDYIPYDYLPLFNPNTRFKLYFTRTYPGEPPIYLGNYYWGPGQKPVPPYDYIDSYGSYVQYAVWFTVEYQELPIDYVGETVSFNFPETKERLSKAANMILNTMFDSGASNEIVGKTWGTDSWIVIYSSQLAMMELIDLCTIFPENASTYLRAAKRFIVWMWSKQNLTDGSFPFILTDGDQHPWYNATTDLWYGYDKIDSFSACAISLMRKYYDATHDLDFINKYWSQIYKAKEFIVSLMNFTYWLPVDGYHYDNDTGYVKSKMNWLHDCCEAYQGIKDYAYLQGVRGYSDEKDYWNTYANTIANAIRTYFWNETLGRYAGMFYVNNGTQNTVRVYNIITPVIYGIETNITRAKQTISEYVNWGILSGRYYEVKWAEDYSIYNEYSTMSGMIYSSFYYLIKNFNYTDMWMKQKFLEVSKFLFQNPIYPTKDLQNNNGLLDYVNLVNYTYAKEYARLIEASAWFINGFSKIPNMTQLYTYSDTELLSINQTLTAEASYWNNIIQEFESETGKIWNSSDGFPLWVEWLKNRQLYVQWYDYMFLKYLFENSYLGPLPWWEYPISPDWEGTYIATITTWVPMMFIFGMFGLCLLIGGPMYTIHKAKEKDYYNAFVYGTIYTVLGFALFLAWLVI